MSGPGGGNEHETADPWLPSPDAATVPPMRHANIRGNSMTKGESRVGIDFNPSGNSQVDEIKRMAADLIDYIDGIDDSGSGEIRRCKAEAETSAEAASMWAVKAATKKPQ
jgi:hypothetical protein